MTTHRVYPSLTIQSDVTITPDPDGGYVVVDARTGTASQGDSIGHAREMITEALELYWATVLDDLETP